MAAAAAILVIVPTTWYATGLPWFGDEADQVRNVSEIEINPSLPSEFIGTSVGPNAIVPAFDGGQPVDTRPKQPTHVVIPFKKWQQFILQIQHRSVDQSRQIKSLQEENAALRAELKKRID